MADAAADLFARHGYDTVAMTQVAKAAGVSEQTLYNYFPTKESLVFDRSEVFTESLLRALAEREPGKGVIDAYGEWLDRFILGDTARRAVESPGGMPRLTSASDALHRALLDLAHRIADNLTTQLIESGEYTSPHAVVLADALLAVFVRIVEHLGRAPSRSAITSVIADARAALDILQPIAHHD
jgi:AcrR family transcriptional regulator